MFWLAGQLVGVLIVVIGVVFFCWLCSCLGGYGRGHSGPQQPKRSRAELLQNEPWPFNFVRTLHGPSPLNDTAYREYWGGTIGADGKPKPTTKPTPPEPRPTPAELYGRPAICGEHPDPRAVDVFGFERVAVPVKPANGEGGHYGPWPEPHNKDWSADLKRRK